MTGQRESNLDQPIAGAYWIIALLFIQITVNHFTMPEPDDQSVLRALSYMHRYPDDGLILELREHLDSNRDRLTALQLERYGFRLATSYAYISCNSLVQLFEYLPLSSGFQSVALDVLCMNGVAVTWLLVCLRRFEIRDEHVFVAALVIPIVLLALTQFYSPPGVFIPRTFVWILPTGMGATCCYVLASVLYSQKSWDRGGGWFAVMAVLSCLLAFLSHVAMAAMFYLLVAGASGCFLVLRNRWVLEWKRCLWLMCLLPPTTFLAKLAACYWYGARNFTDFRLHFPFIMRSTATSMLSSIVLWGLTIGVLAYHGRTKNQLVRLGSSSWLMLILAVPMIALSLGMSVTQPKTVEFSPFLSFAPQAFVRSLNFAGILVLISACYIIRETRPKVLPRVFYISSVIASLLLIVAIARNCENGFAERWKTANGTVGVMARDLLQSDPVDVYRDEVRYFQAVANQLRSNHSGVD